MYVHSLLLSIYSIRRFPQRLTVSMAGKRQKLASRNKNKLTFLFFVFMKKKIKI